MQNKQTPLLFVLIIIELVNLTENFTIHPALAIKKTLKSIKTPSNSN